MLNPPMWPQPTATPEDYVFDKFEFTLSEVPFTKVTAFIEKCYF